MAELVIVVTVPGFFSGGRRRGPGGCPNQKRALGDEYSLAGGAGIREKDMLSVSGEMERNQAVDGSRGKEVRRLSSRIPHGDERSEIHGGPIGKRQESATNRQIWSPEKLIRRFSALQFRSDRRGL